MVARSSPCTASRFLMRTGSGNCKTVARTLSSPSISASKRSCTKFCCAMLNATTPSERFAGTASGDRSRDASSATTASASVRLVRVLERSYVPCTTRSDTPSRGCDRKAEGNVCSLPP